MAKLNYNKKIAIMNCYLKNVIIWQSACALLQLIGYRPREAELILQLIHLSYERDRKV